MKHKNHFWMMVMCIIPLVLIFLLPVFKISSPSAIFIIIVVMFLGHFLMMGSHSGHSQNENVNIDKKEDEHEQHQH